MARALVVMGVSGAGKTAVGMRLAGALGWPFLDGDDLHPAANIERMAGGQPLTDADRAPWLDAVAAAIAAHRQAGRSVVVACSALKRRYRERLREGAGELTFIVLAPPAAELRARLATRAGHFMPASLLDSQLAALEPPGPRERAIVLSGRLDLAASVGRILAATGIVAGDRITSSSPLEKLP